MGFITDVIRTIFTRKIHEKPTKEIQNTINPDWITNQRSTNQLKFSASKIEVPKNQLAEVLSELLLEGYLTRKSAMQFGVLNLTARISSLRLHYNIDVVCVEISTKNKFGRPISYGKWHLSDKDHAFTQYVNKINKE